MTMGEEAKEVQGALALASAPSGSGGGVRRPTDPKLKRSTMIRLGQVLRTEYASFRSRYRNSAGSAQHRERSEAALIKI
jgi:hypothetical protein